MKLFRTHRAAAACALAIVFTGIGSTSAFADDLPPQVLSPDEPTVSGHVVLADGHIDIGPRYTDGAWSIELHTGAGPDAVWRQPSDVVLQVTAAAEKTVPDDPTYAFLHAQPGAAVSVIPQTQQRDVVWVGWNTQDPKAMEAMQQGASIALRGVQGPGSLVVYLQSGNLGAPQVLWDSEKTGDQSIFVDTNTHTHANWVFSQPGIYLVDMEITSTLVDGTTVTDAEPIRFSVGDSSDPAEAFAASYDAKASTSSSGTSSDTSSEASNGPIVGDAAGESIDPSVLAVIGGAGAGLVLLVVGVLMTLVIRSSRDRRRVLAARAQLESGEHDSTGSES